MPIKALLGWECRNRDYKVNGVIGQKIFWPEAQNLLFFKGCWENNCMAWYICSILAPYSCTIFIF